MIDLETGICELNDKEKLAPSTTLEEFQRMDYFKNLIRESKDGYSFRFAISGFEFKMFIRFDNIRDNRIKMIYLSKLDFDSTKIDHDKFDEVLLNTEEYCERFLDTCTLNKATLKPSVSIHLNKDYADIEIDFMPYWLKYKE